MSKSVKNQKIIKIWNMMRPWLILLILFLVFRFTNTLSTISFFAQTALTKIGLIDFKPEHPDKAKSFNYDFSIRDLEDNRVDMNQFKGKVIFLNLWATWCGPCRAEMPSIQSLFEKVNRDSIAFVMISVDRDEDHNKLVKYIKDKQFTFPVYLPSGYLPEQLQVSSIPTTFVVNRDGKIVLKHVGTSNYDTEKFKKFLEDML